MEGYTSDKDMFDDSDAILSTTDTYDRALKELTAFYQKNPPQSWYNHSIGLDPI